MSLTTFAIIEEYKKMSRGYIRLTVSIDTPFKRSVVKFNVWKEMVKPCGAVYDVGDRVKIVYHRNDSFPELDALEAAYFNNCSNCYSSIEWTEAQQMDCDGCRDIPISQQKLRVIEQIQLISMDPQPSRFAPGLRLGLQPQSNTRAEGAFICTIFPSKLYFERASSMVVGQFYEVLAWKTGMFLEIIDIN